MSEEIPSGTVASSVEQVSNAVLVTGGHLQQAGYILQPGKYPQYLMPSLLHECAHWECFSTPVGEALADAFLRSWRYLELDAKDTKLPDDRDARYEASLAFTRYTVCTELLRPLSEGMALFTEFDYLPGSSPVTALSTTLAAILFGDWMSDEDRNSLRLNELATRNLVRVRGSRAVLARKENLLCQPFETKHGGYLPGYYFVKNLRNYLVSNRGLHRLLDGDLFLYVIRVVVFGDLELARLIVDPDVDFHFGTGETFQSEDAINKILTRFQTLLEFLVHDVDEKFIDRLEEVVGSEKPWQWPDLRPDIPEDIVADHLSVIEQAFNETSPIPEFDVVADLVKTNRRLLCLASFDAFIRVNDLGRCLVYTGDREEITEIAMASAALPGVGPKSGTGSLEIYFVNEFDDKAVICVAHLGDEGVACFRLNDEGFDAVKFMERRPSFRVAAETHAEMAKSIASKLRGDVVSSHYIDQSDTLIQGIYMRYCRAFYDDIQKGDLSILKKSGSILDMLEADDYGAFSEYARISLFNGGIILEELMADVIEDTQTRADFLATIEGFSSKYRLPLLHQRGKLWILSL